MACAKAFPLDQVTTKTDVTSFADADAVENAPDDGAYIHGFFLQGARWDMDAGQLKPQNLKELFPPMPVVHLLSIPVEEKVTEGFYECPVYITALRGGTYVFAATLRTDEAMHKWVLAGVAILANVEL